MIQAPANNVIVKVAKNWIKNPTDVARVSAASDENTTIDLADFVQIVGEVVSLPKYISKKSEYAGFTTNDIKPGDKVLFSYLVIFDTVKVGDAYRHRNGLTYEGKEYFAANIKHIFAVIRENEVKMINGWVMLNEVAEPKIIVPQHIKNAQKCLVSEVLYIGELRAADVAPGDTVYFPKNAPQHYELNGKKFLILQQEKILGKVDRDNEN